MGKRAWLEEQLTNRYLPAIAALKDTTKGRAKAEQLAQEMRQDWVERGLEELSQQQGLMDRVRRAIKDQLGEDHFSLELIKFSREEQFELNSQKRQQVGERNLQQQYLDNPDGIVAQAVRLLESPDWAEIAAGLSVLTGRRSTEILKTAEFEVKSQWSVMFKGALKRRGEPVPLVFEIPTLTTAQRVVEAVAKLRSLVGTVEMSGAAVSAKYGAAVSRASDRHFGELVPTPPGKESLYTHLWRSVYACIATFWYCPQHVWDVSFKAHVLGHFEALEPQEQRDGGSLQQRLTTISSERFYALYEVADSVVATHGGKRKGVKLGHGGVVPIEVFQGGMPEQQPVREKRKRLSSVRLWQEDRPLLLEVLAQLGIEEQRLPDRMGMLLRWVRDQLERQGEKEGAQTEIQGAMAADEVQLIEVELERQQQGEPTAEPGTEMAGAEGEERLPIMVEAQLVQQPEIQAGMEEAREEGQKQPVTSGLEQKMDKLLDVMSQFVTMQMQSDPRQSGRMRQASSAKPAIAKSELSKPSEVRVKGKGQRMSRSQTETRINQAINAIMEYNSTPDLPHDLKWAITINTLKSFVKSQRKIEQILGERRAAIEAHHQVQQIDPAKHNLKHRGKRSVTEVIQI
jgi:hypothetical protein